MLTVRREFDSKKIGKDAWRKISEYLEYWDKIWLRGMCDMKLENPYVKLEPLNNTRVWIGWDKAGVTVELSHLFHISGNKIARLDLLDEKAFRNITSLYYMPNFDCRKLLWKCAYCNKHRFLSFYVIEDSDEYSITMDLFCVGIYCVKEFLGISILKYPCDCIFKEFFPKALITTYETTAAQYLFAKPKFPKFVKWNNERHEYVCHHSKSRIVTSDGSPIILK
jgi:hypothetical protein